MAHLIGGVILIALGLWGIIVWWETFGIVMQAVVPLALLVLGSVSILSSYFRLSSDPNGEASDQEELHQE
jgi:hypothetical protein